MDKENFSKQLVEAKAKLKEAQTAFASKSERGDEERMELLKSKLPHILETIKEILEDEGISIFLYFYNQIYKIYKTN